MLQQNLTPLSRALLIASFAIYILQLLSAGVVAQYLGWHPFGPGFFPWQPLTSFLLTGPDPRSAFFGWLGLFFFVGTVQNVLGNRTLGFAMLTCWATAVTTTLVLTGTGLLPFATYVGYQPLLLALVALFGFYMPGQNVLLAFVVPVRGIWFAWGSGILALLWLVYAPTGGTWMDVAAWIGAFVFQFVDQGGIRRFRVGRQRKAVERRFAVHDGGKGKPDWDN